MYPLNCNEELPGFNICMLKEKNKVFFYDFKTEDIEFVALLLK